MEFRPTEFPGLVVVEPKVFRDNRGYFLEFFQAERFAAHGIDAAFVQANHARSEEKGVLRGLHYQAPPKAQAKLVRVTVGAVFDVAVDLRAGSPAFGTWFGIELSADNFRQLFIPKGFAHGYLTLTDVVEFQYLVDDYYAPECDAGVIWNDADLGVDWGCSAPVLSAKDEALPRFKDIATPFTFDE